MNFFWLALREMLFCLCLVLSLDVSYVFSIYDIFHYEDNYECTNGVPS